MGNEGSPSLFDTRTQSQRVTNHKPLMGEAQGLRAATSDIGLKIVHGPFRCCIVYSVQTQILPALRNYRYFIHSATISVRNTALTGSTGAQILATMDGAVENAVLYCQLVPNVANVAFASAVLDILTRPNSRVYFQQGTANPEEEAAIITYLVIQEAE